MSLDHQFSHEETLAKPFQNGVDYRRLTGFDARYSSPQRSLSRIARSWNGNGGLDWSQVRDEIQRVLGDLHEVDIIVYEPTGNTQSIR